MTLTCASCGIKEDHESYSAANSRRGWAYVAGQLRCLHFYRMDGRESSALSRKILWDRDDPRPEKAGVIVPVRIQTDDRQWEFDCLSRLKREYDDRPGNFSYDLRTIEQEGHEIILRFKDVTHQ